MGAPPKGTNDLWVEKLARVGTQFADLAAEETSVLEGPLASFMRSEGYTNQECRSMRSKLKTICSTVKIKNQTAPDHDRDYIYRDLPSLAPLRAPSCE